MIRNSLTDIVLHNYAFSPFSEKIRTTLGLKRIAWRSVDVAPLPPRPLLAALTGGYRRIPVLQRTRTALDDTIRSGIVLLFHSLYSRTKRAYHKQV